MTNNLPVNGHAGLKPLNPAVQQRLIDDSHWERLLVNLHETLNESGWVDLVHDATKETARDGTKNFDQIYTYIQDVAKRAMNPTIRHDMIKVIEEMLHEVTE